MKSKDSGKEESAPPLPHLDEAERGALGGMLLSPDAAGEIASLLCASDFFDFSHLHPLIFSAICKIFEEGKNPDLVLLSSALSSSGLLPKIEGGEAYLADLVYSVPSASNALEYARIVKNLSRRRKVIECGKRIEQIGREEEEGERAVSLAQGEALSLSQDEGFKDMEKAALAARRAASLLEEGEEGNLVFTGFKDLDKCLQGFRPGQLVIVAGRPSMGKSTLASDFARFAAASGKKAAYFSLEMSKEEVAKRMLSAQSAIRLEKLERGYIEGQEDLERLDEGIKALDALPIYLDDSADLSMMEIRTKCRRLKAQGGLGIVVVDYLQLLSSPKEKENRQQEISAFSRNLKMLSKELSCPVIALSQLNRSPEMREGKRPQLSDLRESGSIEQDADLVLLVNRPEVYNPDDHPGEAEIIVAKHRNGKTGSFWLDFEGDFARFRDPKGGYGGF